MEHDRHGARQPHRFDPAQAAKLDDRARLEALPPAELIALLDVPAGGLVVDFGAGTGAYAVEVAAVRPDARIVALDEQEVMLDRLREKLAARSVPNVAPVMARTEEARAIEGKADRVLAVNVLHELGDAALGELVALLAPEGKALFADWNGAAERTMGPPREHVYTPEEAVQRVERFGLRVEGRRLFREHYALVCARDRRAGR